MKYLNVSDPQRARKIKGSDIGGYLNFYFVDITLKGQLEEDGDTVYNDRFYMRKGAPIKFC